MALNPVVNVSTIASATDKSRLDENTIYGTPEPAATSSVKRLEAARREPYDRERVNQRKLFSSISGQDFSASSEVKSVLSLDEMNSDLLSGITSMKHTANTDSSGSNIEEVPAVSQPSKPVLANCPANVNIPESDPDESIHLIEFSNDELANFEGEFNDLTLQSSADSDGEDANSHANIDPAVHSENSNSDDPPPRSAADGISASQTDTSTLPTTFPLRFSSQPSWSNNSSRPGPLVLQADIDYHSSGEGQESDIDLPRMNTDGDGAEARQTYFTQGMQPPTALVPAMATQPTVTRAFAASTSSRSHSSSLSSDGSNLVDAATPNLPTHSANDLLDDHIADGVEDVRLPAQGNEDEDLFRPGFDGTYADGAGQYIAVGQDEAFSSPVTSHEGSLRRRRSLITSQKAPRVNHEANMAASVDNGIPPEFLDRTITPVDEEDFDFNNINHGVTVDGFAGAMAQPDPFDIPGDLRFDNNMPIKPECDVEFNNEEFHAPSKDQFLQDEMVHQAENIMEPLSNNPEAFSSSNLSPQRGNPLENPDLITSSMMGDSVTISPPSWLQDSYTDKRGRTRVLINEYFQAGTGPLGCLGDNAGTERPSFGLTHSIHSPAQQSPVPLLTPHRSGNETFSSKSPSKATPFSCDRSGYLTPLNHVDSPVKSPAIPSSTDPPLRSSVLNYTKSEDNNSQQQDSFLLSTQEISQLIHQVSVSTTPEELAQMLHNEMQRRHQAKQPSGIALNHISEQNKKSPQKSPPLTTQLKHSHHGTFTETQTLVPRKDTKQSSQNTQSALTRVTSKQTTGVDIDQPPPVTKPVQKSKLKPPQIKPKMGTSSRLHVHVGGGTESTETCKIQNTKTHNHADCLKRVSQIKYEKEQARKAAAKTKHKRRVVTSTKQESAAPETICVSTCRQLPEGQSSVSVAAPKMPSPTVNSALTAKSVSPRVVEQAGATPRRSLFRDEYEQHLLDSSNQRTPRADRTITQATPERSAFHKETVTNVNLSPTLTALSPSVRKMELLTVPDYTTMSESVLSQHTSTVGLPEHLKSNFSALQTDDTSTTLLTSALDVDYMTKKMPRVLLPEKIFFESPSCVGIPAVNIFTIKNESAFWLQCTISVSEVCLNGVIVSDSHDQTFSVKPKVMIEPGLIENVEVTFLSNIAGYYTATLSVKTGSVITQGAESVTEITLVSAVAEDPDIQALPVKPGICPKGKQLRNYREELRNIGIVCGDTIYLSGTPEALEDTRCFKVILLCEQTVEKYDDYFLDIVRKLDGIHRGHTPASTIAEYTVESFAFDFQALPWSSQRALKFGLCNNGRCTVPIRLQIAQEDLSRPSFFSVSRTPEPTSGEIPLSVVLCPPSDGDTESGLRLYVCCSLPLNTDSSLTKPQVIKARLTGCIDSAVLVRQLFSLPLFVTVGTAHLNFLRPSRDLIFHCTPPSKHQELEVPLKNVGNIPFTVNIESTNDVFVSSADSIRVQPEEISRLRVKFIPALAQPSKITKGTLSLKIQPSGPSYTLAMEGRTSPSLLCNRSLLSFGGTSLMSSSTASLTLRNRSEWPATIRMKIKGSDCAAFSVIKPQLREDDTCTVAGNSDATVSLNFSPDAVTTYSCRLQIKHIECDVKYMVPLYGYGGIGQLHLVGSAKDTERDLLKLGVSTLSRAGGGPFSITVENTGERCAFVICRLFHSVDLRNPVSDMTAQPNQFIVSAHSKMAISLKPNSLNTASSFGQQLPCMVLISGDEIARQVYLRCQKLTTVQQKPVTPRVPPLPEFLTRSSCLNDKFQGEMEFQHQKDITWPVTPYDADMFFKQLSLFRVVLDEQSNFTDVPSLLRTMQIDESSVTMLGQTVSNPQSRYLASPPTKGSPARVISLPEPSEKNGLQPIEDINSNNTVTTNLNPVTVTTSQKYKSVVHVKPTELRFLYSPDSALSPVTDKFAVFNQTLSSVKFYTSCPMHFLTLSHTYGCIEPKSFVEIHVSVNSGTFSADDLPWTCAVQVNTVNNGTFSVQTHVDLKQDGNCDVCNGIDDLKAEWTSEDTEPVRLNTQVSASTKSPAFPTSLKFPDTKIGSSSASVLPVSNEFSFMLTWQLKSVGPPFVKLGSESKPVHKSEAAVFFFERKSGILSPKEAIEIPVKFSSQTAGSFVQTWQISLVPSDQSLPSSLATSYQVYLRAEAIGNTAAETVVTPAAKPLPIAPKHFVYADSSSVSFKAKPSERAIHKIKITNLSSSDYSITASITKPSMGFSIDHTQFKVQSRHSLRFPVRFMSQSSGTFTSAVTFTVHLEPPYSFTVDLCGTVV